MPATSTQTNLGFESKADAEKYDEYYKSLDGLEGQERERTAYALWTRWKILTDLFWFGNEFLGWKNARSRTNRKKKRIDQKFHKWLANALQLDGDTMILVPRGHLKTSWAKLLIVQKVLQDPLRRVLMLSKSSKLVEQELDAIKEIFKNPKLKALFPSQIPDKWDIDRAEELTLCRTHDMLEEGQKMPDEPQIRVIGLGTSITGMHFDVCFADDMYDFENTTTAEQIQKIENYWAYLQSIMEVDCQYIITGTFYHHSDLYNKIRNERQFKNVFIRQCVEGGEFDPERFEIKGGKVLYSSWFTRKDLMKIWRRQGHQIFNTQYRLNPNPIDSMVFQPPFVTYDELPEGSYATFMAIDPAATTATHSDHTGIAIGMVDSENILWIPYVAGVKLDGGKLAEEIIKQLLKWRPQRVGIEYGLQEHFKWILEFKITEWENSNQRSLGYAIDGNIVPVKYSNRVSKRDRIDRSFGAFVREGNCRIHKSNKDLMRQMELFTGKGKEEDDMVDSVSMLFSLVDRFAQRYWIKPKSATAGSLFDLFKPKKLGWEGRFVK